MCDDATFRGHIDEVCISARKVISWVCRTFKSRSVSTMLTIWKSLILPKLEYCSQLWSPTVKKDIQKLELVQRDFVRKIHLNNHYNYWDILNCLNMYSLQRRRERYIVIYVWKILENIVPNVSSLEHRKISAHYTNRFGRKCKIPNVRGSSRSITLYERSLAVNGPKLFNVMPQHKRLVVLYCFHLQTTFGHFFMYCL